MPVEINSLNRTPFYQSKFLNFLETDDSQFFKENILKISNSKEPFTGFCYGASVKFLHYSDKDLEQEYINIYNRYLDNVKTNNTVIQKKYSNSAMTSVSDYKNYTEKKHIIKQGNKLLKEIFDIQKLQCESVNNCNLALPIPLSSPILEEKNFFKLIDLALNENLKGCEHENDRMLKITMVPIISENRKCAKKTHTLNENSSLENDTIKETYRFVESATDTKSNQKKINSLLDLMQTSTQGKIEKQWTDLNKQQNLTTNIKIQDKSTRITKLDDFINFIKTDKNQNHIILSPNHACAINIKKNTKSETYQFFDPNEGIYKSNNFDEFACFLKNFMDKHQEYEFIKDSDSNYQLSFVKLNRTAQNSDKYNTKKVFDSNLKTNKLLALDNFEVLFKRKSFKNLMLKNKNYRIVHRHFDKKNHLVTLAFHYTKSKNDMKKTIYSSNIVTPILHQVIQNNLALLKKMDGDIFIDKKGNIYPVAPNISMDDFDLNTDPSVMFGSKTLNNQV
ncbi:hypothetical protein [Providencia rettgeri]|uniref:hypothetical protein n=1 Tax=Providencia rettgeri TaxID=587 RepID=UPI002362D851|nr:hypothetical protein [Providencia rettgeri]